MEEILNFHLKRDLANIYLIKEIMYINLLIKIKIKVKKDEITTEKSFIKNRRNFTIKPDTFMNFSSWLNVFSFTIKYSFFPYPFRDARIFAIEVFTIPLPNPLMIIPSIGGPISPLELPLAMLLPIPKLPNILPLLRSKFSLSIEQSILKLPLINISIILI